MVTSRDQILTNIRTSLAANRAMLEAEAMRKPHTPPLFVHPPADDLAEQFAAELAKLEGKPHRCADNEAALEVIDAILSANQAAAVITWQGDLLNLPGLDALLAAKGVQTLDSRIDVGPERKNQLQTLEPALVCITSADVGIAESGTLLLRHGAGRPRLASLLAPIHIAILHSTKLVRGLGEALATIRARHGADIFDNTSNLTLITGPSRTADIEMTLTLGIHGPREIHVLVVG
jgi:L-lactate dehydrogenase complex protein LldG